jgi:hypothetical protein
VIDAEGHRRIAVVRQADGGDAHRIAAVRTGELAGLLDRQRRHAPRAACRGVAHDALGAVQEAARAARHRAGAARVVEVAVRHEDVVDLVHRHARALQALELGVAAQPGVDEERGLAAAHERAVALAAAGQDLQVHPGQPSDFARATRRRRSPAARAA